MKAVAAASAFVVASATDAPLTNLALTWKDCGGKAKIDAVSPSIVPLGTATTITGSGTSPVQVSGGSFTATVKAGWIPLASCSGPLGPAKTCTLPLGAGTLTLDAIPLPIGPGAASISLTVRLSASLPAQLASTTTHATAVNEGGSRMVCLDVFLKDSMSDEIAKLETGGCSTADQAKINARGGGDATGHFPMDTEECGRKCLSFFHGIEPGCFDSCLVGRLSISSGCAHCFWEAAQYGFENCKFACMSSWCSSGCLKCTAPGGSKAEACAGFHSTSQPVTCDADNVVV